METKMCKECGKEKEIECFRVGGRHKDWRRNTCRVCENAQARQYHEDNKESIHARQAQYREDNKEKRKQYDLKYKKLYYERNKEQILAKVQKYQRENSEQIAARHKKYMKENSKRFTSIRKKYREENPEVSRLCQQRRKAAKKGVPNTLTNIQWNEVKERFDNRCAYCGKEKPLDQEHFIALSKSGEYTLNNIIPACRSCNASKGAKDYFEWYPTYENYDKTRERRILKYLGYKNEIQQLKMIT